MPHAQFPSLTTQQAARFWQLHLPASKTVRLRRQRFDEFVQTLPPQFARHFQAMLQAGGDAWLEGIENAGPMSELFPVLREHREVQRAVGHLTFGQQAQVIKHARARMKRFELRNAWGVFRTVTANDATAILDDASHLDGFLERLCRTNGPLVRAHLPLPPVLDGTPPVQVRELTTNEELLTEGSRMSHCVGGYGGSILDSVSRIVSLRLGPDAAAADSATCEWGWRERAPSRADRDLLVRPLEVICRQLQCVGNTRAPQALQDAEAALRAELNAWLEANTEAGWQMLWPGRYAMLLAQRKAEAQQSGAGPARGRSAGTRV